MTDLAAIFDDVLLPVELKNPVTKEPVGVTFYISPFAVDAETDAWERAAVQVELIKNRDAAKSGVSVDAIADIEAKTAVKRCIAAVRKWEWSGKSFGELGVDPACTEENKVKLFNTPRVRWIIDQITEVGVSAANFTKQPDPN